MRLEPYAENLIGEYQAGFRRGRSTADQIFTIKQIAEKFWEYNLDLYHIFIDFRQAYDSIDRSKITKILQIFQVPNKLIKIIQATLTQTDAQVKVNGQLTDSFKINKGLKQGDGLAPMLFNLILEYVIRQTSLDPKFTITTRLKQLIGYADDLALVSRSVIEARDVYSKIKEAGEEIGLQINEDKTKVMVQTRNTRRIRQNLTIEDHNLEVVHSFKYLGMTITDTSDEIAEVRERIAKANKTYYSIQNLMRCREVHNNTKIKLYKTLIKPVATYGVESLSLTQKTCEAFNAFERKILRKIYGPVNENGR